MLHIKLGRVQETINEMMEDLKKEAIRNNGTGKATNVMLCLKKGSKNRPQFVDGSESGLYTVDVVIDGELNYGICLTPGMVNLLKILSELGDINITVVEDGEGDEWEPLI